MLYILHIVYITCRIFYILYILPITFLHITFSFPYDDDGDEEKLRTTTTLTVFPMLMMINEDDNRWRQRPRVDDDEVSRWWDDYLVFVSLILFSCHGPTERRTDGRTYGHDNDDDDNKTTMTTMTTMTTTMTTMTISTLMTTSTFINGNKKRISFIFASCDGGRRTDGRTDGQTNRLIEMRGRI